ncbi:MAG: hypothetical protein WBC74_04995 [Candidatus Omnitrophota bacterium]
MTIDREKRQNRVLEAVIKAHVASALPVGSKNIARILGLSSATIRKVMFELEREGYITHPYTSAGRIPTDLGYRRYVDSMMHIRELPQEDMLSRLREHVNRKRFFEEVIEAASSAVSKITNYTGIALSPSNRLYFDGTYHMLEQPEFRELDAARDFLRAIEEGNELMCIMNRDLEANETAIHIGRENMYEELRGCAIITSTYRFKKRPSGNIGVIGPMRMRYEEVVPIVECLAEMMTEALEGISA